MRMKTTIVNGKGSSTGLFLRVQIKICILIVCRVLSVFTTIILHDGVKLVSIRFSDEASSFHSNSRINFQLLSC